MADGYFLWHTDESPSGSQPDGVLLDEAGRLLTFTSLADLQGFAHRRGLSLDSNVNAEPLDLDAVQRWLGAARRTTVDCQEFLNAWNLFSDFASTVDGKLRHIDDQKEVRIYDKLFWGNNLPALTPPGKEYVPLWTRSEVARLRNVLNKGMQLFLSRLPK